MAKARTYKRDGNGRFASSGSAGRQRPASRPAPRGRNRLTRDNSGRITGTSDGATARGGRLRTGAGNLRATQTARLKRGGSKAQKPKPSRIANRSTADQAHRDKLAKQFKKLDKATRRAYASAKYGKQAISELQSFGSKTQKAIQSTAHQHRKYIRDTVTGQLMSNRQAYGRKALTKQERAELVASVQQSAQGLRVRQSVTRYGRRMGGNGATRTARLKGQGGKVRRPMGGGGAAPKAAARRRPPLATRLAAFESKLKAKTAAWQEEARKADNAFNRNNDVGWTPRAQKISERRNKATRQGESLLKAARAFKQIDLMENPAKYGYARGSAQRRRLAGQIKQERQSLRGMKAAAQRANTAYQASPVVKYGLTSEIGGNRRQGRKAKAAASNRMTSLADAAIGTRIAARQQQGKIAELRKSARTQTMLTNKLKRPKV